MKTILLLASCIMAAISQDLVKIFEDVNSNYLKFNSIAAELSWQSTINPTNPHLTGKAANYQKRVIAWQQNACGRLVALANRQLLNGVQRRQTYILCRGPKFTYPEARKLSGLLDKIQSTYANIQICLPAENATISQPNTEAAILDYLSKSKDVKMASSSEISQNGGLCLKGENDFEKMMEYSKNEQVLKWLWMSWREKVVAMKEPYEEAMDIQNQAAKRNGYQDIGESWRDELEVPLLRQVCRRLYSEVRPLYVMLHGVVRFHLRRVYGEIVPEKGAIPAHLLGNLWSQNWMSVTSFIAPKSFDLNKSMRSLNWTVHHMVKLAEDFYQSMGLPGMSDAFWRHSVFENKNGVTRCHGTAADMFKDGDYRLLYCAGTTVEDFSVLHHELGHIHYYMAYSKQPGLFRQANSALHESIGDAIMHGVMTPQHLHRLRLVNDSVLYVNTSESVTNELERRAKSNGDLLKTQLERNSYDNDKDWPVNTRKSTSRDWFPAVDVRENPEIKPKLNESPNDESDKVEFTIGNDKEWPLNTKTYASKDWLGENAEIKPELSKNPNDNRDKVEFTIDANVESVADPSEDFGTDEILLLMQALSKIPEIPFALAVEEYRWKYFEGGLIEGWKNRGFWDLAFELQGIAPPETRKEEYFDVGAIFHVPDNTAYVRYFLSSFIQHQIFEALCRAAVFGNNDLKARIPDTISLHRCDIYGSKAAGRLLKDFMSRGNSQHWREILRSTTGNTDITAAALKRYYRPLHEVLARIVKKFNIPLGW